MGFFDNIFGGGNSTELKQLTNAIITMRNDIADLKKDKASLEEKVERLEEQQGASAVYTLGLEELVKDVYSTMMSEEEKHLKDILGAVPIESYRDYSVNHRTEAHRIITSIAIHKFGTVDNNTRHEAWNLVYNRMRRITTVDLYNEYDHYYKPKHLFSGAYLDMVSRNELWFRIFKTAAEQITVKERNEWSWQQ